MPPPADPIDLAALRELAEKAIGIDYVFASDTATNSQYRVCANPRTVLALLDRLAAAEAMAEAVRYVNAWDGNPQTDAGLDRLVAPLAAYDRAVTGEKP